MKLSKSQCTPVNLNIPQYILVYLYLTNHCKDV